MVSYPFRIDSLHNFRKAIEPSVPDASVSVQATGD